MSWSIANLWDETLAKDIARDIAEHKSIAKLYCGPAVVVWIAAVWNIGKKGRRYDYLGRLGNKTLFPDGPRGFSPGVGIPGIQVLQTDLDTVLRRETNSDLKLTGDYHRYGPIHDDLEKYDMPILIRMMHSSLLDGLHYVTLYKSHKKVTKLAPDRVKFFWQDNGEYGKRDGGNPGLYEDNYRNVGVVGAFHWGAKRVTT